MSESYKKLIRTLRKLFEMDKADLDFGIYRIMNQKREEIDKFLKDDLLPQVETAFSSMTQGDKSELQEELEAAIAQAREFDHPNPENAKPVLAIKKRMATTVDISEVEYDVYSHLHTFFSRYYDKGDFISLRRYKNNTYAIPYEGEEVKLHWANADQYYIKSSEHLRDYAFTIKTDKEKSVRIKLLEADTEKDNTKAQNGERRFVLDVENPLQIIDGELHIHFSYILQPKKNRQEKLNQQAVETVFCQQGFDEWLTALQQKAPTKNNADRTLLEKHLNDYTARNTFDYFIHKDLGGFLRRELDFYIKNEVLFLDDIDSCPAEVAEQVLRKIKVIRAIAHKLITFLAQLEDFQKKLWLKKKFVVETNYCVTLDLVPKELHEDVITCDAQWQEWVKLGFLTSKDIDNTEKREKKLAIQVFLIVDTRFYENGFKNKLVASFKDIDLQCNGVLFHSENFQVLNILQERYRGKIKCMYIDPPYNTAASEIVYKNNYKNSSWLSLMHGRLLLSKTLLSDENIFCVTIDDFEFNRLQSLLLSLYGKDKFLGVVAIKNNPSGRSTTKGFSIAHEYGIFFGNSEQTVIGRLPHSDKQRARYGENDKKGPFEWVNFRRHGGATALRKAQPKAHYPVFVTKDSFRIPQLEWDDLKKSWRILEEKKTAEIIIYPIAPNGEERVWKWEISTVLANIDELRVKRCVFGKPAMK